ncbi:MAG: U32 family peptidase [Planctomycetaceae bacterium]|nr:U32 family peptidase [Planctomycetaceae bacterium]
MSPAGYWPQLLAAIEAGADAVYFGLKHFSARAKVGFAVDELPEVMSTLHERGVKGFVTFNTLVFDNEIKRAEKAIAAIAKSQVDAIIVQDIGIAKLAKKVACDLEIHGSTQMSITSAEGAEFAREQGCNRVVLGRELSIKDIQKIADVADVELEVFVHGALCVSYSGQCFSSEAWGGRSANRGKCAQACRLSYDLIVDDQHRDLGPDRYLLSPGDLHAISQVPELVRIGISCLKIEGRYKDENYVALTTLAYRQAIDAAIASLDHDSQQSSARHEGFGEVSKKQLAQVYSRGLGPHFMSGVDHQKVVNPRAPRHRGVNVGRVHQVGQHSVTIKPLETIRPGDGVVFDAADWRSPDEPEEGGNVYQIFQQGDLLELRFASEAIEFSRIKRGDLVWRTNDPQLLVQLKPLSKAKVVRHTRPLDLRITVAPDNYLEVVGETVDGISAEVRSEAPLQMASKHGLDESKLESQFGRLGETPFHLGILEFSNPRNEALFLPLSQLNEMRRLLVASLIQNRRSIHAGRKIATNVADGLREKQRVAGAEESRAPGLHLLVRSPSQLEAAIQWRPQTITLDYLELYGLRPSVEKIRAANLVPRVASPRILKPAEQRIIRFLLSLDCSLLVRSSGLLYDLLKTPSEDLPMLIGDFSLNVANAISATTFLNLGLSSITPTYDLNGVQITELSRRIEPTSMEVIAYGHLPVFHTEHCVFCRFMSSGTDHTNCGHPCEKHRVALRDKTGREHPVMADVGCRNTVFGAEAQVSTEAMPDWQAAGLADFRIEFVHETAGQVKEVADGFQAAFDGQLTWAELNRHLQTISPAGITQGSFYVP